MAKTVTLTLPKLHKAQRFIKANRKRFTCLAAGRRFGKSAMGLDDVLDGSKGALEGYPVGWAAPNYKYLLATWREASELLAPVTKRSNSTDKRIELVGGGSIQFLSLDDPAAGRSLKFSRLVIDEAAHIKNLETSWNQALRPTLSDYQGSALFISSTNGANYFKNLFSFGDVKNPDRRSDWQSFRMKTSDNPYINPKEIEDAKRDLPFLVYLQEYEADFVNLLGTLVRSDMFRYKSLLDPKVGHTTMGVDLAISQKESADWCAITVMTTLPNGEVYIRETIRFKKPFNQILLEIQRLAAKWNPALIGIEAVQYQAAVVQELVRQTKLPIRGIHPDKSKVVRFLPLLAKFEQNLVYFPTAFDPVVEAELLSFPVGANDDMVDSMSIAYETSKFVSNIPLGILIPTL